MPQATRETIGFMAVIARWEREQIAKRTKEALAEKKKAGVKLGAHNSKVMAGLKNLWKEKAKEKEKREKEKQAYKVTARLAKKSLNKKTTSPSKRELDDKVVIPTIKALRVSGQSYETIAKNLNKSEIKTRQGGRWSQTQVIRVAKRSGL